MAKVPPVLMLTLVDTAILMISSTTSLAVLEEALEALVPPGMAAEVFLEEVSLEEASPAVGREHPSISMQKQRSR